MYFSTSGFHGHLLKTKHMDHHCWRRAWTPSGAWQPPPDAYTFCDLRRHCSLQIWTKSLDKPQTAVAAQLLKRHTWAKLGKVRVDKAPCAWGPGVRGRRAGALSGFTVHRGHVTWVIAPDFPCGLSCRPVDLLSKWSEESRIRQRREECSPLPSWFQHFFFQLSQIEVIFMRVRPHELQLHLWCDSEQPCTLWAEGYKG